VTLALIRDCDLTRGQFFEINYLKKNKNLKI